MAALKKTSTLLALMFMVLAFTSTANAQQATGRESLDSGMTLASTPTPSRAT